ncbi:hypothetical protein L5515_003706 [Caenorhabditis briggsae]|uniref:Uncharacterized protein n=1 Tax=Caenorhabditis briggsae TaxID=6238 RepID=A0AAE9EFG5_CAEBR|nr:hypothetical protein L5515_003706 [Caenorhabditis briggsae]
MPRVFMDIAVQLFCCPRKKGIVYDTRLHTKLVFHVIQVSHFDGFHTHFVTLWLRLCECVKQGRHSVCMWGPNNSKSGICIPNPTTILSYSNLFTLLLLGCSLPLSLVFCILMNVFKNKMD